MNRPAAQYKNRVLSALPKDELERLTPNLTPVTLPVRKQLMDGRCEHAYFLEEGLASVVLTLADGATVEVGVIGIDGVVGLPILLGAQGMPGQTFMQIPGSGFMIDAHLLKVEFEMAGQLRNHLQRFLVASMVAGARTRLRPAAYDQRAAGAVGSYLPRPDSVRPVVLTHEFLGQMLGSPRTTVTLAAGMLASAGLN